MAASVLETRGSERCSPAIRFDKQSEKTREHNKILPRRNNTSKKYTPGASKLVLHSIQKEGSLAAGGSFSADTGSLLLCIRLFLGVRPHSWYFVRLLAATSSHSGLPVAGCRQCQLRAVCPCLEACKRVLRSSSRTRRGRTRNKSNLNS